MKKTVAIATLLGCLLAGSAYATPPRGWFVAGNAPQDFDVGADPGQRHANDSNAYLRAKTKSSGFGTLMQTFDAKAYRGKRVKLTGFLRTEDALKAQLWVRVDGTNAMKSLAFDNMEQRALHGTNAWQSYDIVVDVPTEAASISFGFLLAGSGTVWADDFKFGVVSLDVPVTAPAHANLPDAPVNLGFEP